LTAHHVLFGDDIDDDQDTKITVVWRQAPKQANGEPPSVEVARKHIAWAEPTLDLALVRCPLPELGVEPPRAESLIARSIPDDRETPWESYGFLSLRSPCALGSPGCLCAGSSTRTRLR